MTEPIRRKDKKTRNDKRDLILKRIKANAKLIKTLTDEKEVDRLIKQNKKLKKSIGRY